MNSLYDQSIEEAFKEWMMEENDRDYVVADETLIGELLKNMENSES